MTKPTIGAALAACALIVLCAAGLTGSRGQRAEGARARLRPGVAIQKERIPVGSVRTSASSSAQPGAMQAVGMPLAAAPASAPACPGDMALVEGEYCTRVEHTCRRWLDDPRLSYARCGDYEPAARCVGERVRKRYCIDRHEYTRPGETKPMNYSSLATTINVCKSLGKRVCLESEWNFACEGEEMRPYPYGWSREPKCNQDQADLYDKSAHKLSLRDLRATNGAHPECVSPFGVYDMVGNMDESVLRDEARLQYPFRNGLKGGWWMSGRNRCRPATTAHDDHYEDVQVGVRCCADVPASVGDPRRN